MRDNEKIAIGWIDPGTVYTGFAAFVSTIVLNRPERISDVIAASGPYLSLNRNKMVEIFLKSDADWLLSLDSDICLSLESFDKLVKSADSLERPVVGGKYYVPWDNGSGVTVSAVKPVDLSDHTAMGVWLTHEELAAGGEIIEGLHSVGIGYVLIHREVFEAIASIKPEKYPWFKDGWKPEWDTWTSDDMYFWEQVRGLGIKISLNAEATSDHLKNFKLNDTVYLQSNLNSPTAHHHEHPSRRLWWWAGKKK